MGMVIWPLEVTVAEGIEIPFKSDYILLLQRILTLM